MLTETASERLRLSDCQIAVEGRLFFKESLKGSVVGDRLTVLEHVSV